MKSFRWIPLLSLPLLLVSCTGLGAVSAKAVLPAAEKVCARHDQYVTADESLTQLERDTYLRSSELLLGTLQEAAAQEK